MSCGFFETSSREGDGAISLPGGDEAIPSPCVGGRAIMGRWVFSVAACLFLVNGCGAAPAVMLTPAESEFLELKVRLVLGENCYKCHSQGAEKVKGGLLLDTRAGSLKGGDSGPAVVPGSLEKILLITA